MQRDRVVLCSRSSVRSFVRSFVRSLVRWLVSFISDPCEAASRYPDHNKGGPPRARERAKDTPGITTFCSMHKLLKF